MAIDFDGFVALVKHLRKECPWDREQTHDSLREAMVEEAYEVVDAIERRDWETLKGELGDVMLNAVFHAVIREEAGGFAVDDVLAAESDKLIARHPHVFGDVEVDDAEAVHRNWEQIKRTEEGRRSVLDGVPPALPALQFAQRVQEKAARVGFDFEKPDDAWDKVAEELGEVDRIRTSDDHDDRRLAEELGDLLFAIVNYARLRGITAETALRSTNAKFVERFRYVERQLEEAGGSVEEASLEEMDELWEEVKGKGGK